MIVTNESDSEIKNLGFLATGDFQKMNINAGIKVDGEAVFVSINAVKHTKKAPIYFGFFNDW